MCFPTLDDVTKIKYFSHLFLIVPPFSLGLIEAIT